MLYKMPSIEARKYLENLVKQKRVKNQGEKSKILHYIIMLVE
jgi:hypothetical protein